MKIEPGKENTSRGVVAGNQSAEELQAEIDALKARLAAYEGDPVARPEFAGEVPSFLFNEAQFIDDSWFAPGTLADYIGPVNLSMVPKNEAARRKMQEHLEGLREQQINAGRLYGRPVYNHVITDPATLHDMALSGQRTAYNNIASGSGDASKFPMVSMPVDRSLVPEMPHTDEALARMRRTGTQRTMTVRETTAPPLMGEQPKHIVVKDRA